MVHRKPSLAASFLAVSALLWAGVATAQETIGEFLDKGAVPLVGDDLVRTLMSSTWRGFPNERAWLSFSADKTFSGSMQSPPGGRAPTPEACLANGQCEKTARCV